MAGLLMPNPLGPMAGLACCGAAAGALYTFRKAIPHPTELELLSRACVFTGCHHHQAFDLLVSVHEAENLPKGSKVYVWVETGRFDARTQDCRTDDKTQKGEFHERLSLHVRSRDDVVKIVIYKKLTLSSEEVGSIELNVVQHLMEEDFPSNKWYTLRKDGKNTSKIQLSFYKLEGGGKDMSPLLQQAMIQTQYEATAKGEAAAVIDFTSMDPKDRLKLLSKALEGPLKMMPGVGIKKFQPFYFKMVENKKGEWEWCWWPDKQSCMRAALPKGKFFMLAVSNVLPDPGSRHQFYMKYHDQKGAHDYMFMRVDRDRDVWSDGLYEFLDRYRDYLDKYGATTTVDRFLEDQKKKEKPPGMRRRPSFTIDPNARRVVVPRAGETDKPKAPAALAAMAKEMYDSDEEDSSDESADEMSDHNVHVYGGGTGASDSRRR